VQRHHLHATIGVAFRIIALKLARDTGFRVRVGAASRDFIETVMTNRRRAARIYVDHLLGRDVAAHA